MYTELCRGKVNKLTDPTPLKQMNLVHLKRAVNITMENSI